MRLGKWMERWLGRILCESGDELAGKKQPWAKEEAGQGEGGGSGDCQMVAMALHIS